MAERTCRLLRPIATVLGVGCLALVVDCADDEHDPHPGEARLLDQACATDEGCVTTGSARVTTGPTSDSTGIRIGPGPGRATIVLPPFPTETYDSFNIEALVAGEGTGYGAIKFPVPDCAGTSQGCTQHVDLAYDYQWFTVGTITGLQAGTTQKYASFYLDVVDSKSHMDVMDVRYTRFVENQAACSTAAPGRRR